MRFSRRKKGQIVRPASLPGSLTFGGKVEIHGEEIAIVESVAGGLGEKETTLGSRFAALRKQMVTIVIGFETDGDAPDEIAFIGQVTANTDRRLVVGDLLSAEAHELERAVAAESLLISVYPLASAVEWWMTAQEVGFFTNGNTKARDAVELEAVSAAQRLRRVVKLVDETGRVYVRISPEGFVQPEVPVQPPSSGGR